MTTSPQPWRAHLKLRFRRSHGRTVLARREHVGPVAVQRPFYPEDGACHVYLLHPPGGLARGDRLATRVDAEEGARALLTTPAATKVYRGPAQSTVSLCLDVRPGACVEWLPQETILFGGSRYAARTQIRLARGARFASWDMLALGRPASGDNYETGEARVETKVVVGGELRLVERQSWCRRDGADDAVLNAPWGLGGNKAVATYYAYPADADTVDRSRRLVDGHALCGSTLLDDLLVVRMLANDASRLRRLLTRIWSGLRPIVSGLAPCPPRIWAT